MSIEELNELYTEVLGNGPALEEKEDAGAPPSGTEDEAYGQEDYSDDADDGTDPRDKSTQKLDDEEGLLGTDDEEFEEQDVDDGEYEEVPDRLVQAGRAANLSDRDIVELSETHPEALEALANAQEAMIHADTPHQKKSVNVPKEDSPKPAGSFEPLKLDFTEDDRDELGERSMSIINTLVDKINVLGGKVAEQGEATETIQQQSHAEKIRAIDDHFDGLAKEIPGLGKSDSLTATEIANRKFAFGAAREAMRAYGNLTMEQALTAGANALVGQGKDTRVKAKIISDLNKNKKRFISRGKSRKKSTPRKTVDERALEAINGVLDDPKYN
jgi:hypothetical protein